MVTDFPEASFRIAGFPSFVLQFSPVHLSKDFWVARLAVRYPPPAALYFCASIWALRALHWPGFPPLLPAWIWFLSRARRAGFVYGLALVWLRGFFLATAIDDQCRPKLVVFPCRLAVGFVGLEPEIFQLSDAP